MLFPLENAKLEGIAVSVDKAFRLVVSIPLLQRAVAVEIERHWIRPICMARYWGRPAGR